MGLLLGFAGRKKSGKGTLTDFLVRNSQEVFGRNPEYIRKMSLASPMRAFCVDYLGLSPDLIYKEENKGELTTIKWENLPHYGKLTNPPSGYMSVRQLLQQVGENMFLEMKPTIWLDIFEKSYNPLFFLSIVDDIRKPEQVKLIQRLGGRVIRLTRKIDNDGHPSETALDSFPDSFFDGVIDNIEQSVGETTFELVGMLREWGWSTCM